MKKGFTLAEVLITLAIVGVVSAITIPSVIANANQQEYKTGLRKAISVLNSSISLNTALYSETPYDNTNLMGYLMRQMSVIKHTTDRNSYFRASSKMNGSDYYWENAAFYTTDGMRFEFRRGTSIIKNSPLYENPEVFACLQGQLLDFRWTSTNPNQFGACGGCGSYGLNVNPDNTQKPPCLIMVDINGDRKPNPANAKCTENSCAKENKYKLADPTGERLTDLFTILITEKSAIPYGVAAQRAMYNGKKQF